MTTRYRETSHRDTFTGQYSYISDSATDLTASASFGLMFYNARWYEPMLGRFTSADTIVPGGVQGLDRYAYVGNNPVRNIDPTGHKCIGDPGECKGAHGYGYARPWSPPTGFLNSDTQQLYDNYMELYKTPDFWNNNRVGNFSIWDFINFFLRMELGGAANDLPPKMLLETVIRNFYNECGNNCDSTNPVDVLLYIIKRHMDRFHLVTVNSLRDNKRKGEDWSRVDFSSAFMDHDQSWNTGCDRGNKPCDWGNKTLKGYLNIPRNRFDPAFSNTPMVWDGDVPEPSLDIHTFYIAAGSGDSFYIITWNQYWCVYEGSC